MSPDFVRPILVSTAPGGVGKYDALVVVETIGGGSVFARGDVVGGANIAACLRAVGACGDD